ncbi:MAG: type II secretion system F family protein [Planctomycetota bacterium]|nr:type II secretion system F family protein [Planctomycetota bacterium]
MPDALTIAIVVVVVAGLLFVAWRREKTRVSVLERLDRGTGALAAELETAAPAPSWQPRLLPLVAALVLGLGPVVFFGVPGAVGIAAGVGAFVFVGVLAGTLAERRQQKLEMQLAEAIDITVSSLRAGVGISDALGDAAEIAQAPLRPQLMHFLSRIRLGEDPVFVCRDTARGIRLEAYRLFYFALAVHWEGGGSLAQTLATTGRFIRDRTEVGRRVRAQSTEARYSVVGILALTYILAALMWRANPDGMTGFVSTGLGQGLVAAAAVLQALGAGWIARMSRIRY